MLTQRHVFCGESGKAYGFDVGLLGHNFGERSGIYLMLSRPTSLSLRVLYVGKTISASDRPGPWGNRHNVYDDARRLGLSAIGFMCVPYEWQRDQIERDLIKGLNPPLNVHHRNAFGAALR